MLQFDIITCKVLLVLAGVVLILAEVCLIAYSLAAGIEGPFPAWVRGLVLVAGLLVIILALRVQRP